MCGVPLIMKNMKKRILAGLIACVTAYSASGNSMAFLSSATEDKPTIQDLEDQKAENDKKIAELKKEIEEAKKDYDSVVWDIRECSVNDFLNKPDGAYQTLFSGLSGQMQSG